MPVDEMKWEERITYIKIYEWLVYKKLVFSHGIFKFFSTKKTVEII